MQRTLREVVCHDTDHLDQSKQGEICAAFKPRRTKMAQRLWAVQYVSNVSRDYLQTSEVKAVNRQCIQTSEVKAVNRQCMHASNLDTIWIELVINNRAWIRAEICSQVRACLHRRENRRINQHKQWQTITWRSSTLTREYGSKLLCTRNKELSKYSRR